MIDSDLLVFPASSSPENVGIVMDKALQVLANYCGSCLRQIDVDYDTGDCWCHCTSWDLGCPRLVFPPGEAPGDFHYIPAGDLLAEGHKGLAAVKTWISMWTGVPENDFELDVTWLAS